MPTAGPDERTPPDSEMSISGSSTKLDIEPANTGLKEPRAGEGLQAWLQVAGAFFLSLNTWGIVNAYGVYQTYYSLDMLSSNSPSAISWIGSIQACLMFFLCFLTGPILERGHLKILLWTGTTLVVVGCCLTSVCVNYWQCFLAQGIIMGIGCGCLYLPAPTLIAMHFTRHLALASGIASIGSGLGGVIFPLMFTQLQPRLGFGWATRAIALLLLLSSVIPLAVMRYPDARKEAIVKQRQSKLNKGLSLNPVPLLRSLIDTTIFHESAFLWVAAGIITGFMGVYTILYYIDLFTHSQTTASEPLASNILIILNGATTVGRVVIPAAADVVGPVQVLTLTGLFAGTLVFCLFAISSPPSIIAWAIVFGALSGATMALPVASIVSASSSKSHIPTRIGIILGLTGIGLLIAEPAAGAILVGRSGWAGLIGWCGALLFAMAIFMISSRIAKRGFKLVIKF